jgi:hypothetical protein
MKCCAGKVVDDNAARSRGGRRRVRSETPTRDERSAEPTLAIAPSVHGESGARRDSSQHLPIEGMPKEKERRPPSLSREEPTVEPVPMHPPYHHVEIDETHNILYGPKRPARDQDIARCEQGKSRWEEEDSSEVRDVYLRFTFNFGVPDDVPPGNEADERLARELAVRAVREARRLLRCGPFNNRGEPYRAEPYRPETLLPEQIRNRSPHPRTEDARADFIFQDGLGLLKKEDRRGDPNRLFTQGPGSMETMPGELTKLLSLLARSTVELQGGVCEKFSAVVMGILSNIAPPETIACKIACDCDHHYVVLRVGTSQWWVADPWPHNAYVLPWSHNYFARESTEKYTTMEVVSPVEDWYGVTFNQDQISDAHNFAMEKVPYTIDDAKFDKNWGQKDNLRRDLDLEESREFLAADEYTWG